MVVQAQYPSNALLLYRKEQEAKEFSESPNDFVLPSMKFLNNRVDEHPRKRAREAGSGEPMAAAQGQQQAINRAAPLPPLALSPMTMVSLARLQSQPPTPPPLDATGLRLSSEYHQNQNQTTKAASPSSSSSSPSLIPQELVAQINRERDEIDRFLLAQGEQLRRALAERRLGDYRALLSAVESSAARRLRQREEELERATRRCDELQERLGRLQTELRAWHATAMASQAMAMTLRTQLDQAMATAAAEAVQRNGEECGESPAADDAESAILDPYRVERGPTCRSCWVRPATVVLLPCRHLCLCEACDALDIAADADVGGGGGRAPSCPVCQCIKTGSLQVLLV